jgi:lambda family phage portal protein
MFRSSPSQHVRRFDGAAHGRRTNGFGGFGRINGEVSGSSHTIRSRARYLAANDPWISQAVANWVGALIGSGIVPTPKHPDQTIRAALSSHFNDWAEDADADGRTSFDGMLADIARGLVIDGESFVQIIETEDGPRLRLIPSELVDESKTVELANGGHIISGVEFDADGRRVAYHVFPSRPTDQFGTYAPAVRIPADSMLHVMKPIAAGQVRGISWLAPVILPANELDQLLDAMLVGVKVAAMHAGFLIDMNGSGEPFDGTGENGIMESGLEPGTLKRIPTGYDIKFSTPQHAQQTNEFVKLQLRQLAAGLGLPSHLLDGDLSGANYSSLRAGLLPFRQRVEALQYHVLVPQLLNPVWKRVVTQAVLFGGIASDDPRDLMRVDWLMPAFMQVDPYKQVQADVAEMEAGLTSRTKLVAARGWNIDDLDAEIAADTANQTTETKEPVADDEA